MVYYLLFFLSLRGVSLANPSNTFLCKYVKERIYLSWFVGITNTFANVVLLLHFHTTKVQLFFHIRKKNNNYFSKKCTFLCIFLAVRKSPAFYTLHIRTYNNKTTSWTHNNNMQHTTDTLHGITTPTHNNNPNTWTHYTHTQQTHKKRKRKTQSNEMNTASSGHSAQRTRWTRWTVWTQWTRKRKHEQTHAQTHEQKKTHTRENTCIYIINKKYKNAI